MRPLLSALLLSLTLQTSPFTEVVDLLKGDEALRIATLRSDRMCYTPLVVLSLRNADDLLRRRAVDALRQMDPDKGRQREEEADKLRPMVAGALAAVAARDPQRDIREEAVLALLTVLRNREWGHHGEPWSDREEVQPLVDLGPWIVPVLDRFLAATGPYEDRGTQFAAVRTLARLRSKATLEVLLKQIGRSEGFLLTEAMVAATVYEDPRVVPTLVASVAKRQVSGYAGTPGLSALMKIKERAVPAMITALRTHHDPEIRAVLAYGFGEGFVYDTRAIPALVRALGDTDRYVRDQATATLRDYPERAVGKELVRALRHPWQSVRDAAAKEIARRNSPTPSQALVPSANPRASGDRSEA